MKLEKLHILLVEDDETDVDTIFSSTISTSSVWRRGGTKPLLLGFHPDYPLNPLVLLVLGHQGTE